MTSQDILLVAAMASLALVITLVDLLACWLHHVRGKNAAHASSRAARSALVDEAAAEARREAIRRRLASIQSQAGEGSTASPRTETPAG